MRSHPETRTWCTHAHRSAPAMLGRCWTVRLNLGGLPMGGSSIGVIGARWPARVISSVGQHADTAYSPGWSP
jgi:hypothetical protein